MDTYWQSGSTVVLQEVWRDRLWSARPVIVVDDRPDYVALRCPKGVERMCSTTPTSRPRAETRLERLMESLTLCDWSLKAKGWSVSTLWFMPTHAWYSVWLSWDDTGEHMGWYVNFQEPFRRTKIGFQTMDLMLDILVRPDRTWEMKDEDEFNELVGRLLIGPQTAKRVRDGVAEVLSKIQCGGAPFDEEWVKWRPDPSWQIPRLPAGWEEVFNDGTDYTGRSL